LLPGRVQIISLPAGHCERRVQELERESEAPASLLQLPPSPVAIAAPSQRDREVGYVVAGVQQRQERRPGAEDLVIRVRREMEHAHAAKRNRTR
jgi:hypothetical protein